MRHVPTNHGIHPQHIARFILFAAAALLMTTTMAAQHSRGRDQDSAKQKKRMAEIERLKQVRLIEELELNEEDAVRLVARQRAHREAMHELSKTKNETLDGMSRDLDSGRTSGLTAAFTSVADVERKMTDERSRFDREVRSLLTDTQFARYLLFEREFQHDVRDAVGRAMKRRMR
jgi:hypothetical protein